MFVGPADRRGSHRDRRPAAGGTRPHRADRQAPTAPRTSTPRARRVTCGPHHRAQAPMNPPGQAAARRHGPARPPGQPGCCYCPSPSSAISESATGMAGPRALRIFPPAETAHERSADAQGKPDVPHPGQNERGWPGMIARSVIVLGCLRMNCYPDGLLAGHVHAQFGFGVVDELSADVHCHAVDGAGEFEGAGVVVGDR
jgi:hypothetical protein